MKPDLSEALYHKNSFVKRAACHSLKKSSDFKKTYKNGKSMASKIIVVYMIENKLDFNRFGFSISKKIGKAVVRNKVRRRFKEALKLIFFTPNFMTDKPVFSKLIGFDFIIVARQPVADSNFVEITGDISRLVFNLTQKFFAGKGKGYEKISH